MERAYEDGFVRAIGVSNFDPVRLMDLCTFSRIKPMVNQVETHVFWQDALGVDALSAALVTTLLFSVLDPHLGGSLGTAITVTELAAVTALGAPLIAAFHQTFHVLTGLAVVGLLVTVAMPRGQMLTS